MPNVFLTDFGLAKDVTGQATGLSRSKLTRSGTTLGTPAYMSPEQARGEVGALRPASDVWALGCVLYECLAARKAFDGETPAAVIGAVLTARPPALVGVPRGVADVVGVCLQREPGLRYGAAGEVAADLGRVASGQAPWRQPVRGRWGWALAVGAVLAIAAIGLGVWQGGQPGTPPAATPESRESAAAASLAEQAWRLRQTDLGRARTQMAKAVALAPDRHDWRVQLGLLAWATDDLPGAATAWGAVPDSAPQRTRAQWLIGLAWAARCAVDHGPEQMRRARDAWVAAAGGTGPEPAWARLGLLVLEDRGPEACDAWVPTDDWTANLLRGLISDALPPSHRAWRDDVGIAAYSEAIDHGIPMPWMYVNRSGLRVRAFDYLGGRADCDTALALRPDYPEALINRALANLSMHEIDAAVADIERATVLAPDDHRVQTTRGTVLSTAVRGREALAAFDRALQLAPTFAEARLRRGIHWMKWDEPAKALEDLDVALAAWPGHPDGLLYRGLARIHLGQFEAAEADIEACAAAGARAVAIRHARGRLCAARGDRAGALASYERALAADPDDVRTLVSRGELYMATGDLANARADFKRAYRVFPRAIEALVNLAVIKLRSGELAEARADLDRAIAARPTMLQALMNRALLSMMQKRYDLAREDLDVVVVAHPDKPDGWFHRARLWIGLREVERCIGDCREAVAVDPHHADAWALLGLALINTKAWAESRTALQRALDEGVAERDPAVGERVREFLALCEKQLRAAGQGH